FAGFHPAGSLGRSLLQVQEVMRSGDELCTVSPETSCSDVIRAITDTKGRPGAAVVVNDTGELVGIFTDGNLRRCLYSGEQFLSDPVKTHMGENPKSIGPEKLIREATALMTEKRIDQIVVVDRKNRPLGLVDIQDAVSARAR
ncbi:CBS domain-containing protein, partial [bacterium]|nr:CBS domain-containing protein [bacterium]